MYCKLTYLNRMLFNVHTRVTQWSRQWGNNVGQLKDITYFTHLLSWYSVLHHLYSRVFSSYPMPPAPHHLSLSLSQLTMWWVFINSSPLQSSAFPLENIGLLLASPLHPPHIPLRSLAPAVRDRGRAASGDIHVCMSVCYVYIQLEKESERQRETQSKSGFLLP